MATAPVLFYTEGGPHVGFGHLRRCLTLASALRALGVESLFLVHGGQPAVQQVVRAGCQVVAARAHANAAELVELQRTLGAPAIVVDSYTLPHAYFSALAATGARLVVIDDLGGHHPAADLVVNPSIEARRGDYPLQPCGRTAYLLGPRYALLRPEFAVPPQRDEAGPVRRVLLTLGGADPHGLTASLLRWVSQALPECALDVVIGPFCSQTAPIEAAARQHAAVTLHLHPTHVRALMLAADLAITAGGQTTYELAATGTPAIGIQVAENQAGNLQGWARRGALLPVGCVTDPDLEFKLRAALLALAGDPARRATMSRRGRALVDGRGVPRVARAIVHVIRSPAT
jgi:UDP-2,4-diacetamido-2,4,6-trideoxy-beta-L-altropyranose hydrolase